MSVGVDVDVDVDVDVERVLLVEGEEVHPAQIPR
jgi:hypothetical protein